MKHKKEINSFICANNDSSEIISQNSLTDKLRDQTNKSIKELGDKYYQIKLILERINIRRDVLYDIGKKLEEEFKRIKYIVPLKAKNRRMKDSLYCWYTENFYNEMILPNSPFIGKIKEYNNQSRLQKSINELSENLANISTNNQTLTNTNNNLQTNDVLYVFGNLSNIYVYF